MLISSFVHASCRSCPAAITQAAETTTMAPDISAFHVKSIDELNPKSHGETINHPPRMMFTHSSHIRK